MNPLNPANPENYKKSLKLIAEYEKHRGVDVMLARDLLCISRQRVLELLDEEKLAVQPFLGWRLIPLNSIRRFAIHRLRNVRGRF